MKMCPHCNTANDTEASFCIECGKPFGQGEVSGSVGAMETVAFRPTGPLREAPLDEKLLLEPGETFAGRYNIVDKIGQGGMGVVYRATEQLGSRTRDIALKLIRADRAADHKAVESLLSEGALIQEIGHPNVVKVYNVGEAQGRPFVAMKFVEGIPLREWHRRRINAGREVPLEVAGAIIHALLDGLEAAHVLGVVHRDLKPENIMLTGEPGGHGAPLQILDFGIARAPDTASARSTGGTGTIGYMAPEQITYPESVQPSADLYSVSRIFYELLMDVLPTGHWQPPSGGRPDVPASIDRLIEQGLMDRPASRPQSALDYRAALAAALEGTPARTRRKSADEIEPGECSTIRKGALFVTPEQDESGKWHMPDMVDEEGKRTQWSWWGGYMKAYPKWMQVTVWVVIGVVILAMLGSE